MLNNSYFGNNKMGEINTYNSYIFLLSIAEI